MTGGNEVNRPNTINATCADGNSGTFHSDESNDRLSSPVRAAAHDTGQSVTVTATIWAWTTPSQDHLDLYFAANANSPTWTLIGTITPTVAGAQTISRTFTLPTGTLQAVRAQFRYQGTCDHLHIGFIQRP